MNEFGWISIIAMFGWLALVIGGYRSYQVGGRKTVTLVLVWAAIFGAVAIVFGMLV